MQSIHRSPAQPEPARSSFARSLGMSGALLLGGAQVACDAHFIDLRPSGGSQTRIDAGFRDVGFVATDQILREGAWEGRTSYDATGRAELVQRTDGRIEIVFSDDFDVDRVPGPVVVLSTRESLGRTVEPALGDIDLGTLKSSQGAQVYEVPSGITEIDYVWVYCDPFGLEVGRAPLVVR